MNSSRNNGSRFSGLHIAGLFIFIVIIAISIIMMLMADSKPKSVKLDLKETANGVIDGIPEAPKISTELLDRKPNAGEVGVPVAQFEVTTPVLVGEPVIYTDLSYTPDSGGNIVNWHWEGKKDFFTKAGVYTVTLKVQNDQGVWSDGASHVVHVVNEEAEKYNLPPIALFKATNPVYVGESVIYEDASYDPDGDEIIDRVWEGKETHFNKPGQYRVTLRVQDAKGKWSDPLYQVIVVKERPVVETQRRPVALFNVSTPVYVGQKVVYTDKSFDQDGDKIIRREWGGDKRESYNKPGKYTVSLRVQDEHGEWSDTFKRTVEVIDSPNKPPVAQFNYPKTVRVNERVTFTNTSYDPDGSIAKEQWGGDKRSTYTKPGRYAVTLTVWDDRGAKDTITQYITVQASANQPPIAKFHTNGPVFVGERVYYYNDSYDLDGRIVKVDWSGEKKDVYSVPGTYPVKITVTDDGGLTSSYTENVVVKAKTGNQPPVAQISGPNYVKVNTTAVFKDESYDTDGYIVKNSWGASAISKTWNSPGMYTVDLEVTDNNGAKSKVTVSIYVTEDGYPPKGSK